MGLWISKHTNCNAFELDEIYWFINRKEHTKTRENTYAQLMISRKPRQMLGFNVDRTNSAVSMQQLVDSSPLAENYYTDGNFTYLDVDFFDRHRQNFHNKNDTYNIESINSDLRHYIPGLARRRKTFYRSLTTFRAVLSVFVNAYNKFGEAKMQWQSTTKQKYPDPPFSVLDYL